MADRNTGDCVLREELVDVVKEPETKEDKLDESPIVRVAEREAESESDCVGPVTDISIVTLLLPVTCEDDAVTDWEAASVRVPDSVWEKSRGEFVVVAEADEEMV